MEPTINYFAVVVSAVLSMLIGGIWYGPLFGKKWMEIVGVSASDLEARKKMQQSAGPLYALQFFLTLFQVLVLAHLIADTTRATGLERSLWICVAFVLPTVAGASMWTAEPAHQKRARFLIQAGYQIVLFMSFGLILHFWK